MQTRTLTTPNQCKEKIDNLLSKYENYSESNNEVIFNTIVGLKMRQRRLDKGITQTKVSRALDVTFQQIQKYEKGTNGVSSNRLMQLSQFLKVPIIFFFEDFKDFKELTPGELVNEDLNYSFLSRTFSSLSKIQKDKILQILNNTVKYEKVG